MNPSLVLLRHALLLATFACASCSGGDGGPKDTEPEDDVLAEGLRYVEDPAFRRDQLIRSLVNPDNGYSVLRLERYTETGWGALPEWRPRVSPARPGEANAPELGAPGWTTLDVDGVPWERDALVELGRAAFHAYPAQIGAHLRRAVSPGGPADRYGLWETEESVGGVTWVDLPNAVVEPAFTCATCHSVLREGEVVEGRNNAAFDLGRLLTDHGGGAPLGWGPGRIDVTADELDNATSIADLRAVRSQTHLQRAATVRNGLVPLAIRTETLIITSLGEAARPPRKLAFALSLYLWQLDPVPVRQRDPAASRGEAPFTRECARCHVPPEYSGAPVSLDVVGTDPAVGLSPERTTGSYRVPTLRGVGDRRGLLASGAVADIEELLDPGRPQAGHTFGLTLSEAERGDLVAFLETL